MHAPRFAVKRQAAILLLSLCGTAICAYVLIHFFGLSVGGVIWLLITGTLLTMVVAILHLLEQQGRARRH